MAKKAYSLLRNGWAKARFRFYRRNGKRILANAAFYLMFRGPEFSDDEEDSLRMIWERLF